MRNNYQNTNAKTLSREEYRRLDNRVTCILQQRGPAKEISQWVGMLKGKQQPVACTIRWGIAPLQLRPQHPTVNAASNRFWLKIQEKLHQSNVIFLSIIKQHINTS